jgi:hypothetical protein
MAKSEFLPVFSRTNCASGKALSGSRMIPIPKCLFIMASIKNMLNLTTYEIGFSAFWLAP